MLFPPMFRLLSLFLLLAGPALAGTDCDACRAEDEVQAGDYLPPAIPDPRKVEAADGRGKEIEIPIPGAPPVYHRPGAGVWIGEAGQGNNVFFDARQNKATLGLRRDF